MNRNSANPEQQKLINELRRRFPLFERAVGQFGKDTQEEPIPWFFALLLSAATKCDPGACCFVLDKTRGTTAVAAVLLALVRLQEDFPQLVKNYARIALRKGQRVKVKPSNYVYEYEGLWEEFPHLFRLKVLDEETKRSFPITEVLRIEPTDRVRPKGKGRSDLGTFERSCLDELLDLTTCGNNSLIRNNVLLYMAQARFAEVVSSITLAPEHANGFNHLSDFLPWGSIGQEGELKPNDSYQVSGEPIIAVTRVPEDLAQASLSAPTATKVVLVDEVRGLVRDLQAFNDIADRQRVVILASPEETEALALLKDRGCPIWYMSPDEILLGENPAVRRMRTSLVGATVGAARTRQLAKVSKVDCLNSDLQAVAEFLERGAAVIKTSEEVHESEEILMGLYGILCECSECCFGVGEETIANLRSVREKMNRHARWLEPAVNQELQGAITNLENIIFSNSFGKEKAQALFNILLQRNTRQWAVAARSPRTAEQLRTELLNCGVNVPVLPIPAFRIDTEYTGIVVPAWPNRQRFSRLINTAVTTDIRVLAYPFEGKWVLSHQASERARIRSNRIEAETRSTILGIGRHLLTSLIGNEPEPPEPTDEPILRIEKRVSQHRKRPPVVTEGEDSRAAQMVHFIGSCYALMTEWAELPRLNQLMDKTNTNGAKLENVTASQLYPGDYVLFRTAGDKELTRLIAEDILGIETYERVRGVAERWKPALQSLGYSTTDVQQHLARYGLNRTTVTIASWLDNPDHIAPRDFNDIKIIATAAGDSELLNTQEEVEDAITEIRGAHIKAGKQLTDLILSELDGRLNQLGDQPLLLHLDYGTVWIVQVDMVNSTKEQYPSNQVNRLLSFDGTTY